MKTKHLFALCLGTASMLACKEKEVDSPEITVLSPKSHEVIEDKDSVRIEAVIKPQNTHITSYTITVKTKNDKLIFSAQRGCDCKALSEVKVKESFFYDISKTSDLFLEINAVLDDEKEIREKVAFVLAE